MFAYVLLPGTARGRCFLWKLITLFSGKWSTANPFLLMLSLTVSFSLKLLFRGTLPFTSMSFDSSWVKVPNLFSCWTVVTALTFSLRLTVLLCDHLFSFILFWLKVSLISARFSRRVLIISCLFLSSSFRVMFSSRSSFKVSTSTLFARLFILSSMNFLNSSNSLHRVSNSDKSGWFCPLTSSSEEWVSVLIWRCSRSRFFNSFFLPLHLKPQALNSALSWLTVRKSTSVGTILQCAWISELLAV